MEEKKQIYIKKICVAIVSSLFLAVLIALVMSGNTKAIIKECIQTSSNEAKLKVFDTKDMQAINYKINGNEYISVNEDPQFVLNGVDSYVENVTIYLGKKIRNNLEIEVFYENDTNGFSAEKMLSTTMEEGASKIEIEIRQNVKSLRIDMGRLPDIHVVPVKIAINEKKGVNTLERLLNSVKSDFGTKILFDRIQIIFFIILFGMFHFIFNVKNMYLLLFKKRWFIAGLVLLFLVINRYHGDSMSMFDSYIQPGQGSEYVQPVFGVPRAIRSDEWVVGNPTYLSTQYLDNPTGKYNELLRATDTVNGNYIGFYSVSNPVQLIRAVLAKFVGYEYAYSFGWFAPILLMILFTIEFFMIISEGKRLLSVCGTCMIVLSSYYLWWGFPSMLLAAHASIVCVYYFIQSTDVRRKIVFAFGTAIFASNFALSLYPAWQVPLGYITLAILVWMVHEHWARIKKLSKCDWAIMGGTILFILGIIISYSFAKRDYTTAITQTLYPGSRIDAGGFAIDKLFNYIAAVLFPYKDIGNASESSACISFFPIPMLFGLYMWIKNKKKDWLLAAFLVVGVFLTIYTTIGLPMVIAKYTLMTFSTSARAVDMLGYLQVLIFVCVLSHYERNQRLPQVVGGIIGGVVAIISVIIAKHYFSDYMSQLYLVIAFCVLTIIFWTFLSNISLKMEKIGLVIIICVSMITGVYVRPLAKGTDAIYSKPLAKKITAIAEKNHKEKWLACGGMVLPSFVLACGASTINSVNTYPNMELWEKLDPTGRYNEVYNRYAHVNLQFTNEDTSMQLLSPDAMILNLSYKDVKKTNAKYIVSLTELTTDNGYVKFNEIYNEYGSYIYEIKYK